MPKISIIVPVYNVEKYMERSINSILNQTYTDIEVLLIDDGSPDNSGKICDEFAKKDSRVKVFHKENGGVSSARNLGLDNATGDYIGFVDPDDIIDPNMYQNMLSVLESNSADLSICGFTEFTDTYEFDSYNTDFEVLTKENLLIKAFVPKARIMGNVWNKLIRKELLSNIRFDELLTNGEDTKFAFDVIFKADTIVLIKNEYYKYFIRNDGAVGNISEEKRMQVLLVIEEIYQKSKLLQNVSVNKKAKKFYVYYLSDTFLNVSKKHQKSLKKKVRKNIVQIFDLDINFKSKVLLLTKIV